MKNRTILQTHNALVNGEITLVDLVNERLEIINKNLENQSNAFLTVFANESRVYAQKLQSDLANYSNNLLYGIPGTIKDNINIKGYRTTGASRALDNYISVYNAEVVTNLYNDKTIFLAKTNLDEFGFGGTGTLSGYGIVKNPLDESRITGGSSSGSAVSVAIGAANFSIGTDTGDSIRKPATFLGIVGYKPSYGVISRYGVLPFSSTLDHVGIFGNDVTDIAIVMDSVAKFDEKDFSSVKLKETNFYKDLTIKEQLNIVVIDDVIDGLRDDLKPIYNQFIEELSKKFNVSHVKFGKDLLDIIDPLYKSIAYSEGASNWNNLTGITFSGVKNIDYKNYIDLMYNIRTNYLGSELKIRMAIGNWFTSHENFADIYQKSKMIRSVLIGRARQVLENADAFILPGASSTAYKLEDILNKTVSTNYCDDALQIANFAGLPSITIPFSQDSENAPFGINLTAKKYDDKNLLNVALTIEDFINKGGYRHE